MVFVLGQMEKNMMDNGKITKSMAQGHTLGLMAEFMKVAIVTTKNMAMVLTFGQTVENISENGKMTKDMGKVYMSLITNYQNKESGSKTSV
jgi:hypothetical protein